MQEEFTKQRWFFLREFTRVLILSSTPKESFYQKILPKIAEIEKEIKEKKEVKPKENIQILKKEFLPPAQLPTFPESKDKNNLIPQNLPGTENNHSQKLARINQILSDPAVIGIECQGADKNILVNRSGRTQIVNIKLSEEEIKNIVTEISEKTKIPLIPGVFKAAFENKIITAVISEFIGIRFILSKRTPLAQKIPFRQIR